MKKLIYIQDNFLDPSLCKPFIDLFSVKKENRSLDAVTHSDPNETLTYMPEFKFDKNYGAKYLGGNVDPITLNMTDDELFSNVINSVENHYTRVSVGIGKNWVSTVVIFHPICKPEIGISRRNLVINRP